MESLSEFADLTVTLAYALASLLLTAAGLDAEYLGFTRLGAGETMMGVWFAFMGAVALAAAAMLVRDRLFPRVRATA